MNLKVGFKNFNWSLPYRESSNVGLFEKVTGQVVVLDIIFDHSLKIYKLIISHAPSIRHHSRLLAT